MSLRLNDLPAAVRAQIEPPAARGRKAAKGGGKTNPGRFRCMKPGCGNVETVWARAERHADTHGAARIECLA